MATRTGRLFQNQNLNVHVNGGGTVSEKADLTGQRKVRAGGRKPLGDLSNAGNLINHFDGKKGLDGSLYTGKPSVSQAQAPKLHKSKNLESDKRIPASEKSLTRSRKALSDISNSGKPQVPEIKNKKTLKPLEESLPPSAISEEQILHDHKKCIKSQFETADVHQFFKTVGLEDDDHMAISFELSGISKQKSESAYLELEEVPEWLPEVHSLSVLHGGSPAVHCKTPGLSSYRTMWNDSTVNFKLIETPKLSKK
ncbi:hypothetical protein HKD37_20G057145 [Glycine soja]|uniref:Protein PATRONUS 2 n=1 Tax=Glycine soja TaxID=3848 RepID=A0A0B2PZF9_GLYSO|nr:uncharacterized protein LOC114402459 [Glycine soja]KHN12942.1 hypothetical protein glysoja_042200 [Glycine soja]RZB44204.1 hypothetical protein D0Y65_054290 [Glycine soja]